MPYGARYNILHVTPFFSQYFGGVAERCYHFSRALADFGHNVTVATTDYGFDRKYASSLEHVDVIPFKACMGRFCVSSSAGKYLKDNIANFDICHLMNHYSYINVQAARTCLANDKPYLFSAMGAMPVVGRSRAIKKLFNVTMGGRLIANADRLVSITDIETRQYLAFDPAISPDRIVKIPNAIYDQYDPDVDEKAFRRRFNIPMDDRLILFVGRLHPIKGPDILIEGFSEYIKTDPQAVLAFVGPDYGSLNDMNELVRKFGLTDRIVICGPLYNEEKLEAYAAADVLVVPSRMENMSIVALEAAAWGTPVIISDQAGFDEIGQYGAGVVASPVAEDIKEALIQVFSDEEKMGSMRKKARELVINGYLWGKVGIRLENLISEVTSGHSG